MLNQMTAKNVKSIASEMYSCKHEMCHSYISSLTSKLESAYL